MSTEAQKRASTNYNRKQDNIMIRPDKETGAAIRAAAAAAGMSVQAYILQAVRAWMESERAGGVPAVSPAVEDGEGVDMVSAWGSPLENRCSHSSSLTPPDFEPAPKQESLADVAKRLSAMSPEERDKAMGCDNEARERYQEKMEQKRKRLAELNAKVGGLSRLEDAERRQLIAQCKDHLPPDDSTQE